MYRSVLLLLSSFWLSGCIVTDNELQQERARMDVRLQEIAQSAKDIERDAKAQNDEVSSQIKSQQSQLGSVNIEVKTLNTTLQSLSDQLRNNAQLLVKVEEGLAARQDELNQRLTRKLDAKLDANAFDLANQATQVQIDELKKLEDDYLTNISFITTNLANLENEKATIKDFQSLQSLVVVNQQGVQNKLDELSYDIKISTVADLKKMDEKITKISQDTQQANDQLVEMLKQVETSQIDETGLAAKIDAKLANTVNEKEMKEYVLQVEKNFVDHLDHYNKTNIEILKQLDSRTNFLLESKASKEDLHKLNNLLKLDFAILSDDLDSKISNLESLLSRRNTKNNLTNANIKANKTPKPSTIANTGSALDDSFQNKAQITFEGLNDDLNSIERDLDKINNDILREEMNVMSGNTMSNSLDLNARQTNQEQNLETNSDALILDREAILNLNIEQLLELQNKLRQKNQ